jgi:hypothetical protein
MEHVRDMLQLCGSEKEVIEKIWTLKKKEHQKNWVFLWKWWSGRNKAANWKRMASTSEIYSLISYHLLKIEQLKKEEKH